MLNALSYTGTPLEIQVLTIRNLSPPNPRIISSGALFCLQTHHKWQQQRPAHPKQSKSKSYSTTHFSFMMLALKPSTANTTRVASTDVKKLMKETRVASKWQLLSCLL